MHIALVAAIASAGLAVLAAPPADTATSATAGVVLNEWKVTPSSTVVRAGRTTFVVQNKGKMLHELVVIRSDRRAGSLPVKRGKVVETGRIGRMPQIASGTSKRLTLTLAPGRYVLLCNLLGHYQAGQFAPLRVR